MTQIVKIPSQMPCLPMPKILKLFKKGGETVKAGELLFSYESDGAVLEERAVFDGFITAIFLSEGDFVSAGTPAYAISDTDYVF